MPDALTPLRVLAEALRDSDPGARERAARALVAYGGPAAAATVAPLLADPELAVCTTAGEVLRQLGEDAVPALIDQLGHPSADVRRQALELLATLPATAHREAVAARLADADPNVVLAAVDALGALGAGPFAPALRRLYDTVPATRPSIVAALARARVPEALGLVAHALTDADPVLQGAAAAALADLEVDALPLLTGLLARAEGATRAVLLDALARWHEAHPTTRLPADLVDDFLALLDDPDDAYRRSAAYGLRALAEHVPPRALLARTGRDEDLDAALFEVLAARPDAAAALLAAHDAAHPAAAAAFALGLLARQRVPDALLPAAADLVAAHYTALDAESRLGAVLLCARHGHEALRNVLLRALDDPDPDTAAAAADALAPQEAT